jgi:hypothetical protein
MPKHLTKDKGDLAVAHVIADLRAHDIIPCLPLSEHLPFDMVAVMPDLQSFVRLQVKYRGNNENDAVSLSFRGNYYNAKKIYNKPVDLSLLDAYALYSGEAKSLIYFRVDEINCETMAFRFNAPKNKQQMGIRMAQDYRNPLRISCQLGAIQELEQRFLSPNDEIAIAKLALTLQEEGKYVLYPQSRFVPFDLLAVEDDLKTIKRYRVAQQETEGSPFVDVIVRYDESGEIRFNELLTRCEQIHA